MPTIQFDDQVSGGPQRRTQERGITGFLIKCKLAKTARGANLILVAFIVIGLSISFFLLRQSLGPAPVPDLPPSAS